MCWCRGVSRGAGGCGGGGVCWGCTCAATNLQREVQVPAGVPPLAVHVVLTLLRVDGTQLGRVHRRGGSTPPASSALLGNILVPFVLLVLLLLLMLLMLLMLRVPTAAVTVPASREAHVLERALVSVAAEARGGELLARFGPVATATTTTHVGAVE